MTDFLASVTQKAEFIDGLYLDNCLFAVPAMHIIIFLYLIAIRFSWLFTKPHERINHSQSHGLILKFPDPDQ
jgi:hypothetical protein